MNEKLQKSLQPILPFIVLGVSVALLIGLLTMFFYVLVWGIVIGGVLWLTSFIKNYFFPKKEPRESHGRIIEHDDKDSDKL